MDHFSFQVPGKWILAGEHAVLRGAEALVFPLASRYLDLNFEKTNQELKLYFSGENSSDLEMIIWSVLERALNELHLKRADLKGNLTLNSHISFGAGMGASATLSVALVRFLQQTGYFEGDLFQFAKKIEDLFHGESSGVDVAVALHQKPLLYKRGQPIQVLEKTVLPKLYLSHSGLRGVTKDCVTKVKQLFIEDPIRAKLVDERMQSAVEKFKKLIYGGELTEWMKAIREAHSCFEDWGLVPDEAKKHIDILLRSGALACKMTGSGGGGYILSLWADEPPAELRKILVGTT